MSKIEVLSPAGDLERLFSAVNFGADAVYLAGKKFGMRTSPLNFSDDQMEQAIKICHEKGVRVYLCVNTLPHNDEVDTLPEFLSFAEQIGVDAFIIADVGIMAMAKKFAPSVELHVSTQFGVTNYVTAQELYNMGAKRVVLARELSLEEISTLRAKTNRDLELETFVHGAMCMSFSGRCMISRYLTGRDANRGDCAQPCRWKYHLYEENRPGQFFPIEEDDTGTYFFNSRDLCMIEFIPQIISAGVSSLKIEGRAKSAYYTAVVTNAYKAAVNDYLKNPRPDYEVATWIRDELYKISHREYSTGFFFGNEPGQVYSNGGYVRDYDVVAVCDGYKNGMIQISQRNKFNRGDILDVLEYGVKPFEFKVQKIFDEWGNEVTSAPHAMQKLFIPFEKEITPGAFFRKKR